MKKLITLALVAIASLCCSAAQADIIFSSSSTDANAGNTVTVQQGQASSIYVWVSTEANQTMTGISFNILADDNTIASGVSHVVENPGPRFSTVQAGSVNTSGNILNNHRAFYLPGLTDGTGISTSGLTDFVLHSTLNFNADNLGSTELTFTPTTAGISFLGVGGNQWNNVTKGTGIINVTAIPEPTSALVLLAGSMGLALVRRRR